MYKKIVVGALLQTALMSLHANASEFEQLAPKVPESDAGTLELQPPPAPIDTNNKTAVLTTLRGLVLIDSPQAVQKNIAATNTGVSISVDDSVKSKSLAQQLLPFINKDLSLAQLDKITNRILRFYQKNDRPVVDVIVPAGQDITDGIVQVLVIFGRLGEVSIQGQQYFSEKRLKKYITTKKGEVISLTDLRRSLYGLNQNPFRQAGISLQRGDAFAESDIAITIDDARPWRVYAGGDDAGSESIGERRAFLGFNLGDVGGWDHTFNYQFTHPTEGEDYEGHSLSYGIPIKRWGHSLNFLASYSESSDDIDAFISTGARNTQLGVRYTVPIHGDSFLNSQWTFGFDYKRSNNNLAFGGTQILDNDTDVSQFFANYSIHYSQKNLTQNAGLRLTLSPGDLGGNNDDDTFEQNVPGANADYIYLNANYNLQWRINKALEFNTELNLQYTNDILLSSEQQGLGGYSTIRGYDEFSAIGDRGIVLRNELLGPRWSFASGHNLRLLAFIDAGQVSSARDGVDDVDLSSVGLGARYNFNRHLSGRIDYGWQLKSLEDRSRSSRVHFSLSAYF